MEHGGHSGELCLSCHLCTEPPNSQRPAGGDHRLAAGTEVPSHTCGLKQSEGKPHSGRLGPGLEEAAPGPGPSSHSTRGRSHLLHSRPSPLTLGALALAPVSRLQASGWRDVTGPVTAPRLGEPGKGIGAQWAPGTRIAVQGHRLPHRVSPPATQPGPADKGPSGNQGGRVKFQKSGPEKSG